MTYSTSFPFIVVKARVREGSASIILDLTKARLAAGELPAEDVGLSVGTVNVHVDNLQTLFSWLETSERLPVGHLDWDDLPRSDDELVDERDKRPPWSTEDVERIFSLPMWTGCASLTKQGRKKPEPTVVHDSA